mgnify:CR=1 FL=1
MPDYLVTVSVVKPEVHEIPVKVERLIRAKNEARAIACVVKDTVSIERADADTIIRLTKAGVNIEVAE